VERAAMCAISGKSLEELEQLSPETQQQLKTTAALFPDALVESELGEIPEGWDASKLGEHFNVVMGQSPKGDTYNEEGNGILFFQGRRDFGFRFPTPRVYTTDPKRFAQAGDTLISVRAPVGDKNMALEECCLGRGVAGIRHKSGSRSFTYSFISYIENNLSNSGSDGTVFNSINKNELHAVPFVAPNAMLVNLYEKLLYSIDQNLEVLSKEIESFEQLRDTLLPKLLSGELTLSPTAIKEKEAIGLSNA
jgi:type I restriction enzyme S subunit